jgi:hypothetical protein
MRDDFHTNEQASTRWDYPQRRVYVYADGTQEMFNSIVHLRVMRTGCHVLKTQDSDRVYIVHPGWRYIIQDPE